MNDSDWYDQISIKSTVCHGKPCINSTRIWISLILDFLAIGTTRQPILERYLQLMIEDIQACIVYGAEAACERFMPMPMEEKQD